MINNDTICALATPAGGAIGVVRVAGEEAISIVDSFFRAANRKPLLVAEPYSVHYGEVVDGDNAIDDVLVSVFRAPHSYTGEDNVEISCHGSAYILRKVLQTLIDKGCRQARAGEYTERAFLNGKLDLSQAEAVADLISATNRATQQMALSQLKGNFSNKLARLRAQLLELTSLVELELDFGDQDVTFADRQKLHDLADNIYQNITTLIQSFKTGNALKQGVSVAIVGKTNVGKSTLLNALVHEEKAIVSDIHGTTRDTIEDTVEINGVTFRFIDTAGLRDTNDEIERIGIERAYRKVDEATIVLWLIDSAPTQAEFNDIKERVKDKKLIIVCNKIDEKTLDLSLDNTVNISAKFGINIDKLEQAIYEGADIPDISENDVIVTNARHYDVLKRAHDSINRVIIGLTDNLSGDLLSEDLHDCIHILAEIVGGEVTTEDVLQNIFKHFCIGK